MTAAQLAVIKAARDLGSTRHTPLLENPSKSARVALYRALDTLAEDEKYAPALYRQPHPDRDIVAMIAATLAATHQRDDGYSPNDAVNDALDILTATERRLGIDR